MKKEFFDAMLGIMRRNKDVYLIFADLGYPRVEEFLKEFPDRVINTGASEQTALDIAVGLAYEGKIPFVYTITPFLLRGFETIRTYINHENLNVKLIGAGRDDDYSKDHGFSHDAKDAREVFALFKNIVKFYPESKEELADIMRELLETKEPVFLSLRR
jgi:transketolase